MIKIKKTTKCDTRALDKTFNITDIESDTKKHIKAVQDACLYLAIELVHQASLHDNTKLNKYLSAFYEALQSGFTGKEFEGLDWWQVHINKERHHLNDRCPEDVNLIDVIEMLCDCVCAGLARTGSVYDINISNDILQKAVKNTVTLLKDEIVVEE